MDPLAASRRAPRAVRSTQEDIHPRLDALVRRHLARPLRKPPAPYSRAAFAAFLAAWDGATAPVLDAGCGTGEGTRALAARHPDRLVVGVDQSAHRLARGAARGALPDNVILLRADVVDIWMLLAEARVRLAAQYLLYPNPWPKPAQVMRRWPAHPVFPLVLSLGGSVECRSNWRVYVAEFARAASLVTGAAVAVEAWDAGAPLTPFERKYAAAGHALFRAVVAPATPPAP
ncbi:MAG: methyltransferase domain-containing protein [Burkholderiales bacterium]|nr:methyltransferase domain-containing protein [Burkholderiales bacterium]